VAEHDIFHQIVELLVDKKVWHETFQHETTVRTSEEAAALRPDYSLSEGAKALIVRVKIPHQGKKFIQAVLEGDKKFDSKKLKVAVGASDLRFATEAEVAEITQGIQPGGVPPFGNLFGVQVVCDRGVLRNERIIFNAGRDVSIAMKSSDYKEIVSPVVASIV
jgi:prolyl-tRNA editing enzyme YbaK/EbsC (Cys-tRNA(Pro) deacylase)